MTRAISSARLWRAYTRIVDARTPLTPWRLSRALRWRRDILDRLMITIEIEAELAARDARSTGSERNAKREAA